MMRTLGFLGAFAFALGIVALLGTGCPPENDSLKKVIIKALSNDGCRGCETCNPIAGEGEPAVEGEGEMPPEGEGEILPEGEGEIAPEGEGESGSLTISIQPAASIADGAQWFVDDETPRESGETVSALTPGSHVLSFKVLAGWIKPVTQAIDILPG